MNAKDFTPEQRKENGRKAAETRRRKKLEARALAGLSDEEAFPEAEIVYGDVDNEPEPAAAEDDDPFHLFLLGLSAETRELLDEGELRGIYAEQLAAARAEKKAKVKKEAKEQALRAARMDVGLVPQATREAIEWQRRMNEPMRLRIEMPPTGDQGEIGDVGLRIDQKIYPHGYTFTFTRSEFDSYREMLYRMSDHEQIFKGSSRRQRAHWMGLGTHIPLDADGRPV